MKTMVLPEMVCNALAFSNCLLQTHCKGPAKTLHGKECLRLCFYVTTPNAQTAQSAYCLFTCAACNFLSLPSAMHQEQTLQLHMIGCLTSSIYFVGLA